MLERGAADTAHVIHRMLVLVAVVCSALLVVSFGLFARDQLAGASNHQLNELTSTTPTRPAPSAPHKRQQPRRFIDGAAHSLTSPFTSIVQSSNQWVLHGLPTFFASWSAKVDA